MAGHWRELEEEFIDERISAWELCHGPVTKESRECLKALLLGCLSIDLPSLRKVMTEAPPAGHEDCRSRCFCERKNRDDR